MAHSFRNRDACDGSHIIGVEGNQDAYISGCVTRVTEGEVLA